MGESGFYMWHVLLGGASGIPCGSSQETDGKWEQWVCGQECEPYGVDGVHPCFHWFSIVQHLQCPPEACHPRACRHRALSIGWQW